NRREPGFLRAIPKEFPQERRAVDRPGAVGAANGCISTRIGPCPFLRRGQFPAVEIRRWRASSQAALFLRGSNPAISRKLRRGRPIARAALPVTPQGRGTAKGQD